MSEPPPKKTKESSVRSRKKGGTAKNDLVVARRRGRPGALVVGNGRAKAALCPGSARSDWGTDGGEPQRKGRKKPTEEGGANAGKAAEKKKPNLQIRKS